MSKPLRALIIEDSSTDAELLLLQLRRGGYDVTYTRVQTADALRAALAESWDVVLSDYSMPGFGGMAALAILQQSGLDIPFIIVSGTIGEAAAVEAMRAGAHDFFLKDNLTRLPSALERERLEARIRGERRRALEDLRESEEKLRQAVHARDQFLSIASHELKTPLTSLLLNAQLAKQLLNDGGPPNEQVLARLDGVTRQASKLALLINNLLEVTRITSGKLAPTPESLDLRAAVQSAAAGLKEALRAAGSTLRIEAPEPVVGRWDRFGIESVVVNLISNAIKFGSGKPIDVEVGAAQGHARLVVQDHGIGIATSEQERIFHRFERAVPDQHYGGFGLGLWIAREITEAHGGTIEVSSEPAVGSCFTVTLPLLPERP